MALEARFVELTHESLYQWMITTVSLSCIWKIELSFPKNCNLRSCEACEFDYLGHGASANVFKNGMNR